MVVETRVPAKINLWLEIVRKREDGYHELSSLMLPVSVFDRIIIETGSAEGPVSLECNAPGIPSDSRNLAWRAAESFRSASGKSRAVHIRLIKEIPSGAGLGGGSADAAGVLLELNSIFGNPLKPQVLEELALGLGADVPFFLHQKPALATGIGEKLEFCPNIPEYPLVLIKPPVNVPTAWVYANLKLTRGNAYIKLNRFNADPWLLSGVIENDLETVTEQRYPVIAELKRWLFEQGALGACMSGSGPTVFGVFKSGDEARSVETKAREKFPEFWVCAANVLSGPLMGAGKH